MSRHWHGAFFLLSAWALSACTPTLAVHRSFVSNVLHKTVRTLEPDAAWVSRCAATLRVLVKNAAGKPVLGAQVVAQQRVVERAIEEKLGVSLYRSDAVFTDLTGSVTVCDPGSLLPRSKWEGLAGGTNERHPSIEVSLGKQTTEAYAPYKNVVELVIAPASDSSEGN